MYCIWVPLKDEPGYWTCSNCERPYTLRFPSQEMPVAKRNCTGGPRHEPCKHLGAFLEKQTCLTCQGNVQVKVFACSVHGKCTIAKLLPGLHCCQLGGSAACHEYEVLTKTPENYFPDSAG